MGGKASKVRIAKAESGNPRKKGRPKASTKPEIVLKVEEPPDGQLQCPCCGVSKTTKGRFGAFFKSNSILHGGNGGWVPICKACLRSLYKAYSQVLDSKSEAMRRICLKIDAYWNEELFDKIMEKRGTNVSSFDIADYLSNLNLSQFRGKTFDTTLDEEETKRANEIVVEIEEQEAEAAKEKEEQEAQIPEESIRMWGSGFDLQFYEDLDRKYEYWTSDLDLEKLDKATDTLIKQICVQEVTLQRDAAAGRSISKTAKVIDDLIGSLNLKPVQQERVKEVADDSHELTPFGVWIRRIEDERPIPEPEGDLRDVDKLREYIQTWFVGGLCNMMRIPNKFSALFEKAMEKWTVQRPEYDTEDEDTSLDAIFEKAEEEFKRQAENFDDFDEEEDDE